MEPEAHLKWCIPADVVLCTPAGGSLGEQSPLRGQSSLPGQSCLQGQSPLPASTVPSSRGSGPRIYVGGIPTAVSETMIRQHFSQWGQVGRTATWSTGELSPTSGVSILPHMCLHNLYEAPGSPNLVAVGMPQVRQLMQVQVTDCYFPKDKYLNRRKNFCFVTFATQQVRLCDSSIKAHWPKHRKT